MKPLRFFWGAAVAVAFASTGFVAKAEVVRGVEPQPLLAQVRRVLTALDELGSPADKKIVQAVDTVISSTNRAGASEAVQRILDPLCLVEVDINAESRVRVLRGAAPAELVEHGWRCFLVKVINDAGVTAPLEVTSSNALALAGSPAADLPDRWLDLQLVTQQPLEPPLSGLKVEYRVLELYSRDAGKREATLSFDVGQGTQDLGYRSDLPILFDCKPARRVTWQVKDEKGLPATGCFVIRDHAGRIYPPRTQRLAPDFAFQSQIYIVDGETTALPDGRYSVEFSRGPESIVEHREIAVSGSDQTNSFQVRRWIDPSSMGWWSGDHHIHAAGCSHYSSPTQGVLPSDMIRHCMGEDLKVGCTLTWGPCFDYQKQFFCGQIDQASKYPYLLRYDIEVSGFGSHQSGHLCLLLLREENYPGANSTAHWPTLGLNVLRWAKRQGAITGTAHSGYGLKVEGNEIPNYQVPLYNGIGANEFIVDITHAVPGPDGTNVPAVDFYSLADTPCVWELSMWYHVLNAGFHIPASGETDFPCIQAERVGMGRSYVKLNGELTFDHWCEGLREGKSYVSDGRSHLLEFKANGNAVGENGSEVQLTHPGTVHLTADVAARLDENPQPALQNLPQDKKPFWNLERARMGNSRKVMLEVIVDGNVAARQPVLADGVIQPVAFDIPIARSSWVALRILGSSHSNPIWVTVAGAPWLPKRRDVEWCLRGVNQCWSQKQRFISPAEMDDAVKAYDHARAVYQSLLTQAGH